MNTPELRPLPVASLDESPDASSDSHIAINLPGAHNQSSTPQFAISERYTPGEEGEFMTSTNSSQVARSRPEIAAQGKKKFRVVLADPPWSLNQMGKLGAIQHYDLMNVVRIRELPVADLMMDDSWCFLWVTNNTLWEGPAVLKAWGFDLVKQPITWAKFQMGLGQPLRNSTEHLLLGRRGHPKFNFRGQPTHLIAPRQEHSHKPEEQFALIERFTDGPYLELFARRRPSSSADWSVWGNEIDSDISIPGYPVPSDFDDQGVK